MKPGNTITRTEALLYAERQKQNALRERLRAAIDLATTYLNDGAAYSALRVLKDAVAVLKDAVAVERGEDES